MIRSYDDSIKADRAAVDHDPDALRRRVGGAELLREPPKRTRACLPAGAGAAVRRRADLERARAAYAGCGGCVSGAYGKASVLAPHRRTPASSPAMDARRRFELGTGTESIESTAAEEIDVSFASKTLGQGSGASVVQ